MTDLKPGGNTKTKGFTLKGAVAFIQDRYGEEGMAAILEALDPESREIVAGSILASTWYPFRVQVAIYEAVDRVYGAGDFEFCREIGKFTSDYEMNRIHKLFLRIASLEVWIKSAGIMWGRYYNQGGLEIGEIGPGAGTIHVTDFDPISKAFCLDFAGWLHRTLELNGMSEVAVAHDECVLDGAPRCVYRGTWTS